MLKAIIAGFLVLQSILWPACNVQCGRSRSKTHGHYEPIAPAGPQTWLIEGTPQSITSTYILDLPEGLQFTFEMRVPTVPKQTEAAIDQAWPAIRYAFVEGLYQRTSIPGPGGQPRVPDRIGVVLFRKEGIIAESARAGISASDIRARLVSGFARDGE